MIQPKTQNRRLNNILMLIPLYLRIGIGISIVIFIFVVFCAFTKKRSTLVQMELTVRNVSFNCLRSEGGQLFASLPAERVRFVYFQEFTIPFARAEVATGFDVENLTPAGWETVGEDGELIVMPTDIFSSIIFENVILNELNIRDGSRVRLSVPQDEDRTVKIVVEGQPTDGNIIIADSLMIECQYCQYSGINVQGESALNHFRIFAPQEHEIINFRGTNNCILLNMNLPGDSDILVRNIYIEKPAFVEGSGKHVQTSVIESGKIFFKDLDNKETVIESHDFVKIGKSENLQITRMAFQSEGIELVLNGKVDELKTGTKDYISNQLPSILEWLYHQKPLILLLQTIFFVGTAILTVFKRLKNCSAKTYQEDRTT